MSTNAYLHAQLIDSSVIAQRRSGQRIHARTALVLMVGTLALAGALETISIVEQLRLVLAPIVLLGILHGGADPWVGRCLMDTLGVSAPRRWFYAAYLSLMAIVLMAWWLAPLTTLAAFLLISILHFGEQDATTFGLPVRLLDVIVLGSLPVFGPVVAHPGDVAVLFGWLSGVAAEPLEQSLRWALQPVACLWLIGVGMVVSRVALERGARRARRMALAICVVASVMFFLPPLIAFALYFCLLHSFGHVLEMATARDGPWTQWTLAQWGWRLWPATAGAVLLGIIGAWVLDALQHSAAPPGADAVRVLFWGLAALTVPHVLLHAVWQRRRLQGRGRDPEVQSVLSPQGLEPER